MGGPFCGTMARELDRGGYGLHCMCRCAQTYLLIPLGQKILHFILVSGGRVIALELDVGHVGCRDSFASYENEPQADDSE